MKYIAVIDEEMLSNFRIDDPLVMVVTDKMGLTRGIPLKPIQKEKEEEIELLDDVYRDISRKLQELKYKIKYGGYVNEKESNASSISSSNSDDTNKLC